MMRQGARNEIVKESAQVYASESINMCARVSANERGKYMCVRHAREIN
jgi:hypothetical protein